MTANTTFTAGQVLTATAANSWPRGLMATPVTSITSDTTITAEEVMLTYVFTAVSGRNYLVTYSEPAVNGTVSTTMTARLREDSLTGTAINSTTANAISGFNQQIICQDVFTATASGSKTLVATLASSAGTATASRASTRYAEMSVIDIGSGY